MASAKDTAIIADSLGNFSLRNNTPVSEPDLGEVQVRVSYSGANPADIKHTTELGVTDTTLGYDFAGIVIQSRSSRFKDVDVVTSYTPTSCGRLHKRGTHQDILVYIS
ncbi:hypothetical protein LTR78_006608 [Recurvomyces mirabilis]|uniref:Alcohol dehydrogenase-like N-terminal domain-containing protein n=1 Tax=Recurvomyces mirabilis TaxID=574656 RepID=A0AAE0WKI0_9PEZI|nr:hypothetical protein LTR78_006608 [Recurvomyces mirabilis]KAK5151501.1 hypothetical protein LTS14_009345 [Recurvomyces mirabilis]